jgi:MFS family permease
MIILPRQVRDKRRKKHSKKCAVFLADRFGRRTALWLALAALHIGQFSSALAPNKWAYLVARHFAGIGVVRKDIKSGDPPPCFLGGSGGASF